MQYRNQETGAVLTFMELCEALPDRFVLIQKETDSAFLATLGYDLVVNMAAPVTTRYQTATLNGVEFVNGEWRQAWAVTDWAQEQIDASVAADKAQQWEAIKAERDRREAGGVLVGDKWFHSDEGSRIKQLGLVMAGAGINAANIPWKTMDGSFVTMTQTLAGQIFSASLSTTAAIFAASEQHRAAMGASADPAVYDFSTGWPLVYGE